MRQQNDTEEMEELKELKLAFERVFKSTDGQVILSVLGGECIPEIGKYESDPYKMAYKEGQRYMLMKILSLSNIEMEKFLNMYRRYKWNSN